MTQTMSQLARLRRRDLIAGVIGGLAAAPLLAACSSAPQPTATPVPATPAPPRVAAAPATPEVKATPSPALAGEILVVLAESDSQSHQALADAYMQANSGVKVRIELKAPGNADEFLQYLKTQFAAGVPQISILNSAQIRDFIQAGKILNQAPYLSRTSPYTGQKWSEGFESWALEIVRDPTTGEMYMSPYESTKTFWVYNKRIFGEAGITSIPTQPTWSDLVGWCQKIKAKGYIPIAMAGTANRIWTGGAIPWLFRSGADQYTRDQLNVIRAQKGDWAFREGIDDKWQYDPSDPFNDDPIKVSVNPARHLQALRDKEIRFDNDAWADYIGNMNKLFGGVTQPGWMGTQDAYPLFLTQRAATFLVSGSFLASFERDIRKLAQGQYKYQTAEQNAPTPTPAPDELSAQVFEYSTFNFASMEGPYVKAKARSNELTAGYLSIPKKDRKQNDLEMDFVMFWTSPQGMSVYVKNRLDPNNLQSSGVGGPPIVKGVQLPSALSEKFASLKFIGNYEKSGNPGDAVARGFFKYQPSVRDWVDLVQSYFRGEMTAREYADRYQKLLETHWADVLKFLNVTSDDLDHPEKRPPNWTASGPY